MGRELRAAGLDRVNISLDSLRPERFFAMTRRDELHRVLDGIGAAIEAGFDPVKINVVLQRGVNDAEIVGFPRWRRRDVRFIEFAPLGASQFVAGADVVSQDEIVAAIDAVYPLEPIAGGGGARRSVALPGGAGDVGSSSVTSPSAATATGPPHGRGPAAHVHSRREFDLRARAGGARDDVAGEIGGQSARKWAGHAIGQVHSCGPNRSMSESAGSAARLLAPARPVRWCWRRAAGGPTVTPAVIALSASARAVRIRLFGTTLETRDAADSVEHRLSRARCGPATAIARLGGSRGLRQQPVVQDRCRRRRPGSCQSRSTLRRPERPGPVRSRSTPIEAGSDAPLALQRGRANSTTVRSVARKRAGQPAPVPWDLHSNALRPEGWTSADAAGLPILPGLLRYDEVASGVVTHAIRITFSETYAGHIHPATHDASSNTDPALPPMGLRLRLAAGFDLTPYAGAARVILVAMQHYGVIVADNGSNWFFGGATDPRWNDGDLDQLKRVPGSAFEAVETGGHHRLTAPSGQDLHAGPWQVRRQPLVEGETARRALRRSEDTASMTAALPPGGGLVGVAGDVEPGQVVEGGDRLLGHEIESPRGAGGPG